MQKKDRKSQRGEVAEMLALIFQISISMIVPIGVCTYIGYKIGQLTGGGAGKYAAVIGFVIGAAAGMNGVYRLVKKYLKRK